MSAITFTLADAKREVYLRLRGQEIADQNVGRANVIQEINFAQLSTMMDIGLLEHAGALAVNNGTPPAYGSGVTYDFGHVVTSGGNTYMSVATGNIGHTPPNGTYWALLGSTPTGYTFNGSTDQFTLPADCLLPCFIEFAGGTAVYVKSGNIFQISKTPMSDKEVRYAFVGGSVYIRPCQTSGAATLYYIKKPELLVSDTDALLVSPTAFAAVVLRAAWGCLGHMASASFQLLQAAEANYRAEVASLRGEVDSKYLAATAVRLGRDPMISASIQEPPQG